LSKLWETVHLASTHVTLLPTFVSLHHAEGVCGVVSLDTGVTDTLISKRVVIPITGSVMLVDAKESSVVEFGPSFAVL
jgi:hypothetical protein